mmetsp:Transcript_17459/g.35133  ORF Transcript_17459/g.35133 Transcript_17459/m.35133 type:complete len:185 (+) Transcript_17459:117-671(+)
MSGNNTATEFCNGMMAMSMFMDGFHRSLGDGKGTATPDCLIYLVSGWVLDDKDKFKGALVFSFLLAILMEVFSAVRGAASHWIQKNRPLARFVCLTLIYTLQAILGYLLMFLAMTYSIEILLATVAGLCVGNLAFFRYEDFQPHRKRRNHHRPQQQQRRRQQPPPQQGADDALRQPLLPASSRE